MTHRSDQRSYAARLLVTLSPFLLLTGHAPRATAQDILPQKSVSVRDRPRPEYAPPGVTWGAFRLRPDFTVSAAHTDNVFATETDNVGDRITTLSTNLTARSQGARLPLSLNAEVDSISYADNPLEDHVDWASGASTAYSFPRMVNVELGANLAEQHESRSEPSFPSSAAELPEFETSSLALRASHEFASGSISLAFNRESLAFDDVLLFDGTPVDQEFRDRDADAYQLQGNFVIGPSTAVFVRAVHQQRDYANESGGLDRDAKTDGMYAGAVFDLTNLMRGEVGLGTLELDNADASQQDSRSTSVTSSVEFFLTQLMTATVAVGRGSGAADIAGISSYIGTNAALTLDYEIRRNVIASASVSQTQRDYSGIDEKDTTNRRSLSAQWLLNRHAKLMLTYATTDQAWHAAEVGRAYEDEVVSVSAIFAL